MNEVQERELEVYKKFAEICKEHGLTYFAIGGTCIGAVRHKGFIPWDDDIDVAMPRKDYEKFRTHYYRELPGYIKKLDCENARQHTYTFSKIHDARTTYVERYAKNAPERYTGAFVDIMPVDGLPDDTRSRERAIRKFRKFNFLNDKIRPVPLSIYQGARLGIVKFCGRIMLGSIFPYNHFSKKIKKFGEKWDFRESEFCIFTWRAGSADLKRERIVFPSRFFLNTVEIPFEDTVMKIPEDYDAYLTQDFGAYMKLPPKEQRRTIHNIYIQDMNTPASHYAKRDMKVHHYFFRRK